VCLQDLASSRSGLRRSAMLDEGEDRTGQRPCLLVVAVQRPVPLGRRGRCGRRCSTCTAGTGDATACRCDGGRQGWGDVRVLLRSVLAAVAGKHAT